jgi:hypothetical protein
MEQGLVGTCGTQKQSQWCLDRDLMLYSCCIQRSNLLVGPTTFSAAATTVQYLDLHPSQLSWEGLGNASALTSQLNTC